MDNLRAAVIGVGYLGSFHAQKYQRIRDVELVAVVDENSERLSEVSQRLNVPGFLDYTEVAKKVDLVSIVVPPANHYDIGVFFLEKNIHCLIEKPLAERVEDAQHLIEIAKKRSLILQVGHLERFNPMAVALKNNIKTAQQIHTLRHSIFKERGTEVDVVLDSMIHDIDFVLDFEKSKLKDVEASGVSLKSNAIDVAKVKLFFESGLLATLEANRVSKEPKREIWVETATHKYFIDFLTHATHTMKKSDNIKNANQISKDRFQTPFFLNELPKNIDILKDEIMSFIEAIKFGKSPLVSGEDGKKALEVCLEIMDRIRS